MKCALALAPLQHMLRDRVMLSGWRQHGGTEFVVPAKHEQHGSAASLLVASAIAAAQFGLLEQLSAALHESSSLLRAHDHAGRTCLHHAAAAAHVACVQLLLARGADVCARDRDGNTPLHGAARRNAYVRDERAEDVALCVYLIASHQPLCCVLRNNDGTDAVQVALERGSASVMNAMLLACAAAESDDTCCAMKRLLCGGAACDTWEPSGRSALAIAAAANNVGGLLALLDAGATVDIEDTRGRTALMWAAKHDAALAAALLLQRGAVVSQRDRAQHSALEYAAEGSAVHALLQQHTVQRQRAADIAAQQLLSEEHSSSSKQHVAASTQHSAASNHRNKHKSGSTSKSATAAHKATSATKLAAVETAPTHDSTVHVSEVSTETDLEATAESGPAIALAPWSSVVTRGAASADNGVLDGTEQHDEECSGEDDDDADDVIPGHAKRVNDAASVKNVAADSMVPGSGKRTAWKILADRKGADSHGTDDDWCIVASRSARCKSRRQPPAQSPQAAAALRPSEFPPLGAAPVKPPTTPRSAVPEGVISSVPESKQTAFMAQHTPLSRSDSGLSTQHDVHMLCSDSMGSSQHGMLSRSDSGFSMLSSNGGSEASGTIAADRTSAADSTAQQHNIQSTALLQHVCTTRAAHAAAKVALTQQRSANSRAWHSTPTYSTAQSARSSFDSTRDSTPRCASVSRSTAHDGPCDWSALAKALRSKYVPSSTNALHAVATAKPDSMMHDESCAQSHDDSHSIVAMDSIGTDSMTDGGSESDIITIPAIQDLQLSFGGSFFSSPIKDADVIFCRAAANSSGGCDGCAASGDGGCLAATDGGCSWRPWDYPCNWVNALSGLCCAP